MKIIEVTLRDVGVCLCQKEITERLIERERKRLGADIRRTTSTGGSVVSTPLSPVKFFYVLYIISVLFALKGNKVKVSFVSPCVFVRCASVAVRCCVRWSCLDYIVRYRRARERESNRAFR